MANYYNDNSELKFHLNHPLMEKIVRMKERDFSFKDEFQFAPTIMKMQWITTSGCLRLLGKCVAILWTEC
jgi:hypothetical protein